MTKVSAFSKETFLAVKANPEAFDDDRMLGSFNVGPVVCRIYLNEDDEGFYDDWPNLFLGKYVIEAIIDVVGGECYDEKDGDCYIYEDVPYTCMGEFPVFLEETYEDTTARFQQDFYNYILKKSHLTERILESEMKARRFVESFDEELYKELQAAPEAVYKQFVVDPYIAKLA